LNNAVGGVNKSPLTFSPDGAILASGTQEGTVVLWDPATGERVHALRANTWAYVTGAAFLRDGATLVVGTFDGRMAVWDTTTSEQTRNLYGHTGSAVSVAFFSDGATLASAAGNTVVRMGEGISLSDGSGSATLVLWDVATGWPRGMHADPNHAAFSAVFTRDGSSLAFGTVDGTVLLWDVAAGELAHTLAGHAGRVYGLAFSPDGATLASGAEDGTVVLWDAAAGRALRTLKGHHSWVTSLAFSADGSTLAAGTSERNVVLWKVKTGKRLHTLETSGKYVTHVAFSPDGSTLASKSYGGYLDLWDPAAGTYESEIVVGQVTGMAFSPDGRILALGKRGRVAVLDAATLEQVHELVGNTETAYGSVAFSPDGSTLAAGAEDGTVALWHLARSTTGDPVECQVLPEPDRPVPPPRPSWVPPPYPTPIPTRPMADADTPADRRGFGSLTVHVNRDKRVGSDTIWLLVGDRPPRQLAEGRYSALSPDGCSVLVSRETDRNPYHSEYVMLDVTTSSPRFVLSNYDLWHSLVYGLEWAPDSERLALTLGGDIKRLHWGDLWLVDASDGSTTLFAGSGAGEPLYSPDGRWVATFARVSQQGNGDTVGLWSLEDGSGGTLFSPLWRHSLEWADDSSGFAAALNYEGGVGFELWWAPVDGTPVKLGSLPEAMHVVWQPGARRLAWSPRESGMETSDTNQRMLHLANRDGGGVVMVPGSGGMKLGWAWGADLRGASVWSPDGRWLLVRDDLASANTYLVDTERLDTPFLLGVSRVHGWIDATHYLASAYHWSERYTNLYLCMPPVTCRFLARLEGEIQGLSYTEKVCKP
jgi:WD40 repeat protein